VPSRKSPSMAVPTALMSSGRILDEAQKHLTADGGLLCEIGRCRETLEMAYPRAEFLWLDTEDSTGEVFWIAASDLANLHKRGD